MGGQQQNTVDIDGPQLSDSDVTHLTYSEEGDLTSAQDAVRNTVTYGNYDSMGHPGSVTDANRNVTTYTYDDRGRINIVSKKLNNEVQETRIFYDGFGDIKLIEYPDGSELNTDHDAVGRKTARWYSIEPWVVERWSYNALSKPLTHSIDTSGIIQFHEGWTYDTAGRVLTKTGEHGQQWQYAYYNAGFDQPKSITDALGHATSFTYNTHEEIATQTDAAGQVTQYDYDGLGNLATVTDPRGLQTAYAHDGFGNLTELISPDTGTTRYIYDEAGNVVSMVRANGVTTDYTYDDLSRMKSATIGLAKRLYTYDSCTNGKGKLCKISEDPCLSGSSLSCSLTAGVTTSFDYNDDGMLAQQVQSGTGAIYTTKWEYDGQDRLTKLTYPGGNSVSYHYDLANRATSVTARTGLLSGDTSVAYAVSYKPFGPMTQLIYGNNLVRNIGIDTDYRAYSIAVGSSVQGLTYSYDSANRLTGVANSISSVLSQGYAYDALSRLTAVNATSNAQSWTFDENGNRKSHTYGGSTDSYVTSPYSNRLTSVTGARARSYTLDSLGNVTARSGYPSSRTYKYDAFNQLAQVTAGSDTVTYSYNGLGLRVEKEGSASGKYRFNYSPDGYLLSETPKNNLTTTRNYIWLNGELIAYIDRDKIYYVHDDRLGRPEAVTDSGGAVVWRASNYAYDRTVTIDSIGGLNLGFPGQYYDSESGLWYNWNRYYDASIGRYLQSDPIGLLGGLNTYTYVGNNPISFIDPLGLSCRSNLLPDIVTLDVSAYVFSFSVSITADGNLYYGPGAGRAYASPSFSSFGASLSGTYLIGDRSNAAINNFAGGLSYGVQAYGLFGGGLSYSPSGGVGSTIGVGLGYRSPDVPTGGGSAGASNMTPGKYNYDASSSTSCGCGH